MNLNSDVLRNLIRIYNERKGSEEEAIGCITNNGDVLLFSEDSNWSELYDCEPYDAECIKRIKDDLRQRGCFVTFHLHSPKDAILDVSGMDIISTYLLDMPDAIVHRSGIMVVEPLRKLEPKEVWEIDEKCWYKAEGDYILWKACLESKLPLKKEKIKIDVVGERVYDEVS